MDPRETSLRSARDLPEGLRAGLGWKGIGTMSMGAHRDDDFGPGLGLGGEPRDHERSRRSAANANDPGAFARELAHELHQQELRAATAVRVAGSGSDNDRAITTTRRDPRTIPLPRPARGACTRVRLGRTELILEPVRGGFTLLANDGTNARRWALGLPRAANDGTGELAIALRAPRLPLAVTVREPLALAPRGRLRGYVTVPLVPVLVWQAPGAAPQDVAELLPEGLDAEWRGDRCVQCCASAWLVRFPVPSDAPRAVVPLVLENATDATLRPAELPLHLDDSQLVALRGSLVTAPRRLAFRCPDTAHVATCVRTLRANANSGARR